MDDSRDLVTEIETLGHKLADAKASITKRFIGQEGVVDLVLSTVLCGGHGLLIGLPGLGKTRLVDTLSTVLGLDGARVQFTPDLMPADILGSEVLETGADGSRAFKFIEGPIFCQLLMADEINRASPRTQSALLQAMQEKSVTIAGQPHALPAPFHVSGDAEPDRAGRHLSASRKRSWTGFSCRSTCPIPTGTRSARFLWRRPACPTRHRRMCSRPDELIAAQALVRRMPVGENVMEAILDLVRACRPDDTSATDAVRENVGWGPGPRAAQSLMLTVRARALLDGRLAPSVEDVASMAAPVLSHRMALTFAARARGMELSKVIGGVAEAVTRVEAAA